MELQKQVSVARTCLTCMQGFQSCELCQRHMCRAGHTVFKPEQFVQQFIDFYDFTASYPEEFLKLIKAENDQSLLDEIAANKFYVSVNDFKYYIEGEQVGFMEWKDWKAYHVPEWLKIKQKQTELLQGLRKLRGAAFADQQTGNFIQLRSEA